MLLIMAIRGRIILALLQRICPQIIKMIILELRFEVTLYLEFSLSTLVKEILWEILCIGSLNEKGI